MAEGGVLQFTATVIGPERVFGTPVTAGLFGTIVNSATGAGADPFVH